MTTLLVGFDSAWAASNSGALVGVLQRDDGTFHELGWPQTVDYGEAERLVLKWQAEHEPTATIILLDQPTIVRNATGQRAVENLVGSPVSRRGGGMQPANRGKEEMFGEDAPVWRFLRTFGGPADPLNPGVGTRVFETYPTLAIISLGWTLPDTRTGGRLPKYNPERDTFSIADWRHVCSLASDAFRGRGLTKIAGWVHEAGQNPTPRKLDQDHLDACLCLLVALCLAERGEGLMVGDLMTGYIVVPHCAGLRGELEARCTVTGRAPSEWVRAFRLPVSGP